MRSEDAQDRIKSPSAQKYRNVKMFPFKPGEDVECASLSFHLTQLQQSLHAHMLAQLFHDPICLTETALHFNVPFYKVPV